MTKTIFDWSAALIGLTVLSPLLIFVWIALLLPRDGPAVFRQTRVGRHQRPYTLYKFRTLPVDTEAMPTHMLVNERGNAVAQIVRAAKIDELPQLWNVLRGEMSLVGPRPCLTTQTDLIEERESRGVFALKPGITGYAQVRGIDMRDAAHLAEADAIYIKRRSFAGDMRIILATFGVLRP